MRYQKNIYIKGLLYM